ncbi:MAG: hypothetical protein AVO33_10970 [delta proteobacterium ML8_F1]|nr:MAG: hypothetical protein AVO33_10970 [delta proteobacterium ML8_F1]
MKEILLNLMGWLFFLLGSLAYTFHGLVHKDPLSAFGGMAFVLGCIFFMIPLGHHLKKKKKR